METILGYIENIVFQTGETGFTVAKLKISRKNESVVIVGTLPSIHAGETIECRGNWSQHGKHGVQFRVEEYQVKAPSDVIAIEKYLASGFVKGIGPKYAKAIVSVFGEKTLDIIDESPEKLREVPGIGSKRLDSLISGWDEQKALRHVMLFLQGNDISPAYAQKILHRYGARCVDILSQNPYLMARDIHGIGFKVADKIARKMGVEIDSPHRICAGIEFYLNEIASQGNVCCPEQVLIQATHDLLEVPHALIFTCLEELIKEERVIKHPISIKNERLNYFWLKVLYYSELGIAKELKRLSCHPCAIRSINIPNALSWVQEELLLQLADNQSEAVSQAMTEKVQIITGGPGTGKSTITQAILTLTEKLKARILLAAPTGRAAKRMSEICQRKAKTIHQLLEFDGNRKTFKRNIENPLECDLLIVDEASMIDTYLMFALLKAVPSSARLIFVGDIDQLPSVGPGNVLRDIIESKEYPVTRLTEIFRQAKGSKIIVNAHSINSGYFPNINSDPKDDFFFISKEDPHEALQLIVHLVSQRIPSKYNFRSIEDIQVLSPMKKGILGTENLNMSLQKVLNDEKESLSHFGRSFHKGDKVMQLKNNYDKNVYNGDVGKVRWIDSTSQSLQILFDDHEVDYTFHELDQITLAYAVSVHKYQGSESPCIIMPVHTTHFKLLFRNLLYTGVTRGKQLVVLVGMKKALAMSVRQDEVKERHSGLIAQILNLADFTQ